MARPRTIKIGEGQVVLRNLPPDISDLIEVYLENLNPNQPQEARVEDNGKKLTALTIRKNNKMWELVEIRFSSESSKAEVVKITPLHETRAIAISFFKTELVKRGII